MLETIKQRLQARTENNAIKSELTWVKTKRKGKRIVSQKEITEVVYLKRSRMPIFGDWARIYPAVDEKGNWIVGNLLFGGRRNFLKLLAVLGIVAVLFMGYNELLVQYDSLRTFCEPFMNIGF